MDEADDEFFEPEPCAYTDVQRRGWAGKHPVAVWNPVAGEWQCQYCRDDWTTKVHLEPDVAELLEAYIDATGWHPGNECLAGRTDAHQCDCPPPGVGGA